MLGGTEYRIVVEYNSQVNADMLVLLAKLDERRRINKLVLCLNRNGALAPVPNDYSLDLLRSAFFISEPVPLTFRDMVNATHVLADDDQRWQTTVRLAQLMFLSDAPYPPRHHTASITDFIGDGEVAESITHRLNVMRLCLDNWPHNGARTRYVDELAPLIYCTATARQKALAAAS